MTSVRDWNKKLLHGELETQTLLLKGHVWQLQGLVVLSTENILPNLNIAKRCCGFILFLLLVSESRKSLLCQSILTPLSPALNKQTNKLIVIKSPTFLFCKDGKWPFPWFYLAEAALFLFCHVNPSKGQVQWWRWELRASTRRAWAGCAFVAI